MLEKGSEFYNNLMLAFQQGGDMSAFNSLVDHFTPSALAGASQILYDRSMAEDAVQEAFMRVIRARHVFKPESTFSSWFFTILRNVCIDFNRRKVRYSQALEEASASTEVYFEPKESVGDVDMLLGRLPDGERQVLILRIVHGFAFQEISEVLDISAEAAKKRAQRGLKRLREMKIVADFAGLSADDEKQKRQA